MGESCKRQKSFTLILGAFFSAQIAFAVDVLPYKDLLELRLNLCSGKSDLINSTKQKLDKILSKNPENFSAYWLRNMLFAEDENKTTEKFVIMISNHEAPKNDLERVMFSSTLLNLRNTDLKSFRDSLNFESRNNEIEAFRLDLSSEDEALNGNLETAFNLHLRQLALLPVPSLGLDSILNERYLNLLAKNKTAIDGYISKISLMDERDPYKIYLEARVGERNKSLTGEQVFEKIARAHSVCPADVYLSEAYAYQSGMLYHDYGQYNELKSIMLERKFYSPAIDLAMGVAAANVREYEVAEHYLKLAEESYLMSWPEYNKAILKGDEFLKRVKRRRVQSVIGWSLVSVVLIIGILVAIRQSKKRKRPARDLGRDEVYNPELEAAEKRLVESQGQKLVGIWHHNSNEADTLDAIAFLNSKEIDATYEISFSINQRSFTVKTPITQAHKAKKLLEEYLKKKAS
jgi:hypothetical protein